MSRRRHVSQQHQKRDQQVVGSRVRRVAAKVVLERHAASAATDAQFQAAATAAAEEVQHTCSGAARKTTAVTGCAGNAGRRENPAVEEGWQAPEAGAVSVTLHFIPFEKWKSRLRCPGGAGSSGAAASAAGRPSQLITNRQAVAVAAETRPGVAVADIRLRGLSLPSSFIITRERPPPRVLSTAVTVHLSAARTSQQTWSGLKNGVCRARGQVHITLCDPEVEFLSLFPVL